ncbi:mandelate racemase/muconate lactonizing enzyme family protein [Aliamphritea ceti]|uniref:mandelate racemase/muconate lactonizing enzyme family protein n=1 Tax=Aliamphritea ceti TaxID=1524258 RepID=UPI0021C4992B|nr:mandelate racemase/muconate lactonizing enzyme family protein [Aliamphritea ceti]
MKVTGYQLTQVSIPLSKPLITAIHRTETVGCVLLSIETDAGLTGEGYVFALNQQRLAAFTAMIDSLMPLIKGQNPLYVEKHWQAMWLDINPAGLKGVTVSAMSAIDTALWDIVGKRAGLPLYQLFGASRDEVKTYASSGLWLSASVDELIAEAHDFVAQGFRAVKLRLGKPDMREDVSRVKALRESLGDSVEILTDANQSLTPRTAINLARKIADYDITWLEEPVAANDFAGHRRVLEAIDIPLASGETEYTSFGMKDMLEQRTVDVLMPDLQRIGGLSEMRKTVAIAATYHTPISTHIFTEQSLSIAGSAANCISVEHVDWFAPLFNEKITVCEGLISMPQTPGLGFSFDWDYIDQHRL